MRPEEYIEALKTAKLSLDGVKEDLDRAIQRMERCMESGDESMATSSRLAALAAYEYTKIVQDNLLELAKTKVDYQHGADIREITAN